MNTVNSSAGPAARPPGEQPWAFADVVAARIRARRQARGISVRKMSEAMVALGFESFGASSVQGMEGSGRARRRRLAVEELIGVALVLKTSPSFLMVPAHPDAEVALTPASAATSGRLLSEWVRGMSPLPSGPGGGLATSGSGTASFGAGAASLEQFLEGAPEDVRQDAQLRVDAGMVALGELRAAVRRGLVTLKAGHDPAGGGPGAPEVQAEVLRRELGRVGRYVRLLAGLLEQQAAQAGRARG